MKFLEGVAAQLISKHGHDLSKILVLMPNQRSCTYLRNELQAQAQQAIFAPQLSTLQNCMLRLSEWVLADNIELLTELFACHQQIGGGLSMDDFIGIGQVLLKDFEELDLQMADAKSFFKNLEALQSMKTYEPGKAPSEYKLKYRRFWEEFGLLYNTLKKNLAEKGKAYRGMMLRQVAETTEKMQALEAYHAIYLVGFSGLNRTDEVFISFLINERKAELIWDADKYYVNDKLNDAGYFFRKYRSKFKINESVLRDEIAATPKIIEVIGAAKSIGQVKVVADILQNRLQLDEHSALETVVVMPDEKLLSPLIAHLPDNIPVVNITMGISMAGSNAASWVEILFRMYENAQRFRSSSGTQRFYYKDVFSLLQHNFFRLLFGNGSSEEFIQKMKHNNRTIIGKEEIAETLGAKAESLFFEGESSSEYARYLIEHISQLLDKLIQGVHQGNYAWSSEVEITHRLLNIIKTTGPITAQPEAPLIGTLISLLRESISSERIPLEGDPVKGLQIMGLQETRSLDFKNVIILSANEGIFPSGKNQRTYIPHELRKEFLTTYRERDAVTAYLFYRLLQKGQHVFILYNTEPDELGGGDKSRFILQLQHELKNDAIKMEEKIFAVNPPAALEEPDIRIQKREVVMEKLLHLLTTSGLSPSALNTYINCSLQYYFRYIAGLREQEDMEESLDASTIGSAVHDALESIYKERLGQTLDASFIEKHLNDKPGIELQVREPLKLRFDQESLSRGKNLLLYKVCVKLVEEFLKHETKYLQQLSDCGASMQIMGLEEDLEYRISVNGIEVKIIGRTDRIEQIGEVIQIADYKTGTRSPIPILTVETWENLMTDPKFSKPVQLLIYAWLYFKNSGNKALKIRSGIYWLRDANKELNTLSVSKDNDLIQETELLTFEEKLKATLQELMDENIPFFKTEDEKRCQYCEFAKICGRD